MRSFLKKDVIREKEDDTELDPVEWARDEMIKEFGPRTASWLVWNQRRKLHRRGLFDVVIPPKVKELPKWFELAIAQLRRRDGWSVDIIRVRDFRRFRIRWHGWLQNGRAKRVLKK